MPVKNKYVKHTHISEGKFRQCFPKSTDFNKVTDSQIEFVMKRLNTRPRKMRGGKQPVELLMA